MQKLSTLLGGLFTAFLLCFTLAQASAQGAGNKSLTLVMRVTVDGVAHDFNNGRCGYSGFTWSETVPDGFCGNPVWPEPDSLLLTATPATNLNGKIALIRRGTNALSQKAKYAEASGAVMALIANNYASANGDDCFVTSAVGGGADGDALTIPALFLSRAATDVIDDALAAGQTVQICFLRPDVEIASYFFPPSSVQTPVCEMLCDTFGFGADLTNGGDVTRTNVVLTAYVEKADGSVIFSASTTVPEIAPGDTVSVTIPDLYPPQLAVGDYAIRYTTSADPVGATPLDGQASTDFHVTTKVFAKEDGATIGYRPGTVPDSWATAAVYQLCAGSMPQKAKTVEFTYATNAGDTPADSISATIYLFRVNDDILPDWSNFEGTDFFSPSMTWVGFANYVAPTGAASFGLQKIDIQDLNTGEVGVTMDPGARYMVVVQYSDNSNTAFQGFNEDQDNPGVSTAVYTSQWFLGGFGAGINAVIRLYLEQDENCIIGTEEAAATLPAGALAVIPNPVQNDRLNLAVNFDQPTDAAIMITDLNGRLLLTQNRRGLTQEVLTYDLPSQLAAGMYLVRISTAEGSRTVKFVVQQ